MSATVRDEVWREAVRRAVADAPPLTEAQRARLAGLLRRREAEARAERRGAA